MLISGLTLADFRLAVAEAGTRYGGNLGVSDDAHEMTPVRRRESRDDPWYLVPRCRARVVAADSHGPGARTSWTGRHGPYACWHAYRDVLADCFRRSPQAVITAGNHWTVTYRGTAGFEALYPSTGQRNIGSEFAPVTMPELCQCSDTRGLAEVRPSLQEVLTTSLRETGQAVYPDEPEEQPAYQNTAAARLHVHPG